VTSSRPRGGLKTATRTLVKELVSLNGTKLPGPAAALGVLGRLEVTHISFFFLLFAHITFLSCVFGFGFCQSRRIVAVPLRPSPLRSGRPSGSAYLWNAFAVELHALQNLRPSFPSTNSRAPYYHQACHEIFGMPLLARLSDNVATLNCF